MMARKLGALSLEMSGQRKTGLRSGEYLEISILNYNLVPHILKFENPRTPYLAPRTCFHFTLHPSSIIRVLLANSISALLCLALRYSARNKKVGS